MRKTLQPVILVLLATILFAAFRYAIYRDWMAFVDYDGYFSYFIARWGFDVNKITPLMDNLGASYRYQRIVYPISVYFLNIGGHPTLTPLFLVLLNIISITLGTYFVSLLLNNMNISPWYSLVYGLYGGQFLGLMTSLTEPMAFLFIVMGIYFWDKEKFTKSIFAFTLAILTKEIALLFVLAFIAYFVLEKKWGRAISIGLAIVPYVLWQVVLFVWLDVPGISSGKPFEFPLWGWLSGLFEKPDVFILLAIALFPMSYLPMIILGVKSTIDLIARKNWHPYVLMVFIHVGFMIVLPRWTAREPSAMVRITQGLMLSTLLYGSLIRSNRILNYSVFWIATLALIVNGAGRNGVKHFN